MNDTNIEKIKQDFVLKILNQTYTSEEYINKVLEPIIFEIKKNKDKTPEEIVDNLLRKSTISLSNEMANILRSGTNTLIPGYTFGIKAGNIDIKIYGGNFGNQNQVTNNTIFDIASISKMYTQLICYNLINEGYFSFDSKIEELDERFTSLGDLTVKDITTFSSTFNTPGRIDDQTTTDKVYEVLFNTKVVEKDKYNYNDIGMIILKEVMEKTTGLSYEELLKKYITHRLDLPDTHLILPEDKKALFTGSGNETLGLTNDAKAVVLGGYSGHAGVKTTSDDLLKFAMAPFNKQGLIPEQYIKDLYSKNPFINDGSRGVVGSAKLANPKGLETSDSSILAPKIGYSAAGSTRTQVESGIYSLKNSDYVVGTTVLLNPSAINHEEVFKIERKINEQRKNHALEKNIEFRPISIMKKYQFEGNEYHQVSSQGFISYVTSTDPMITKNSEFMMQLLFLQEVIATYEKDYQIDYKKEHHIGR